MKTSDFDYELPQELIAQTPTLSRSGSRLLHLNGVTGGLVDRTFPEIYDLLAPGDLLVLNDTKVIKARLYGNKATGGSVEVLIERVVSTEADGFEYALAHVRASKSPKPGSSLHFATSITATVGGRVEDLFELRFEGTQSVYEILELIGEVPLPPYITHKAANDDELRYQTVYAAHQGSVAAPTAGLHFDEALLGRLAAKGVGLAYVTLHVGAGTFRPVRDDDVSKHVMHSEWYHVPESTANAIARARAEGGKVVAVGTTSMRTLESAARSGVLMPGASETSLFITPGYQFQVVDRLITNFHLPKSTLMMLVSAFAGYDNTMAAYKHAVRQRYRFFSYGDAMFINRRSI